MAERHSVIPRTLCLVFYGDEILMIKGSEKKDWSGIYNALGGHIEKGESVIESAEREIREESGLTVFETKLKGIVHASNFFGKDVLAVQEKVRHLPHQRLQGPRRDRENGGPVKRPPERLNFEIAILSGFE